MGALGGIFLEKRQRVGLGSRGKSAAAWCGDQGFVEGPVRLILEMLSSLSALCFRNTVGVGAGSLAVVSFFKMTERLVEVQLMAACRYSKCAECTPVGQLVLVPAALRWTFNRYTGKRNDGLTSKTTEENRTRMGVGSVAKNLQLQTEKRV